MSNKSRANFNYANHVEYAKLDWDENLSPISEDFDDVYFSKHNGLAESNYVFLSQNNIAKKLIGQPDETLTIAESGFGTGLNLLALCELIEQSQSKRRIHYISFEMYPLQREDLIVALQAWPSLKKFSDALVCAYPTKFIPGCNRLQLRNLNIQLDLWIGDIHQSLSQLVPHPDGLVDCWFLDGFAPSKNPQMWTQSLFDSMAKHSKNKASFATFTAAGNVRRGLVQAGFDCQKVKGFAFKREMLRGDFMRPKQSSEKTPEQTRYQRNISKAVQPHIAVVGAGIAGCNMAYALTQRGFKVTLIEQSTGPAQQASGNPQGAVYPLLLKDNLQLNQFYLQACAYQKRLVESLVSQGETIAHQFSGVFESDYDEKSKAKHLALANLYPLEQFFEYLQAQVANQRHGLSLDLPGIWHADAGWLNPRDLCVALLNQATKTGHLALRYNSKVASLKPTIGGVSLGVQSLNPNKDFAKGGHNYTAVVFSQGYQIAQLQQAQHYPIQSITGQIEQVQSTNKLQSLHSVICHKGYLTPSHRQSHCVGASHRFGDKDLAISEQEREQNLKQLNDVVPAPYRHLRSRVSVRGMLRDHLPLLGAMPDYETVLSPHFRAHWQQQALPSHPNCYCFAGLGARGLSTAALAAEILASEISGEALPIHLEGALGVDPGRMLLRRLAKNRPLLAK